MSPKDYNRASARHWPGFDPTLCSSFQNRCSINASEAFPTLLSEKRYRLHPCTRNSPNQVVSSHMDQVLAPSFGARRGTSIGYSEARSLVTCQLSNRLSSSWSSTSGPP